MGSQFDEPISSAHEPHSGAQAPGLDVTVPVSQAGHEPVHFPTREELQDTGLADVQAGIDALSASPSLTPLVDMLSHRIEQLEQEAKN